MSAFRDETLSLRFTAGFLLLSSLLWLLDTGGLLSALLPAVCVHEAGHALALRLCGARVRALRFEACGLRMDYSGALLEKEELLCALAGPAAGLLWAITASLAGRGLGSEYLLCSAGISLALTAFNLLPAPMLDGGRALSSLGLGGQPLLGLAVGGALLLAGALSLRGGFGAVLLAAGAWTAIGTCKTSGFGIQ